MRAIVLVLGLALPGCATLGVNAQSEAAILALVQIATGVALGAPSASVCAQLATVQPPNQAPCANPKSQSTQDLLDAFAACAIQTATAIEFFRIQAKLCPTVK